MKKIVAIVLAGLLVSVLFARAVKKTSFKDTYKPDPHFYDSRIINTIKKVQADLKDITGDGEINCQDAAISFKIIWNNDYPRMQNKIQICRNYNPPIMDHLFVYIWVETGERIDIEPRCFNPYRFEMKYTWGDKYDPKYNWYGETDWWLDKAGYYDWLFAS